MRADGSTCTINVLGAEGIIVTICACNVEHIRRALAVCLSVSIGGTDHVRVAINWSRSTCRGMVVAVIKAILPPTTIIMPTAIVMCVPCTSVAIVMISPLCSVAIAMVVVVVVVVVVVAARFPRTHAAIDVIVPLCSVAVVVVVVAVAVTIVTIVLVVIEVFVVVGVTVIVVIVSSGSG